MIKTWPFTKSEPSRNIYEENCRKFGDLSSKLKYLIEEYYKNDKITSGLYDEYNKTAVESVSLLPTVVASSKYLEYCVQRQKSDEVRAISERQRRITFVRYQEAYLNTDKIIRELYETIPHSGVWITVGKYAVCKRSSDYCFRNVVYISEDIGSLPDPHNSRMFGVKSLNVPDDRFIQDREESLKSDKKRLGICQ